MAWVSLFLFTLQFLHSPINAVKYKIERSPTTKQDTIYLSLNGDPKEKCSISLLTYQNDTISYQPIKVNNENHIGVSCEGLYNFSPGDSKETYYVRVTETSSMSDTFLTLRNMFEKPLYAKVVFNEDHIVFETTKLCYARSVCQIKKNNIPIKFMANNVECHHVGSISSEFSVTKDRLKLVCGDEQAPLYVYTRNTHLVKDQQAKQYSISTMKGKTPTDLEVMFTNARIDEICQFQVREGTTGNTWVSKCGLTNHDDKCFRPCNNITISLTTGTETSYTLKIKNKHMSEYYENTFKIGKNIIKLEDITETSVKVRLDLLGENNYHCLMKLYYEDYPGYGMSDVCGENGKQPCDTKCSIKILSNLKLGTSYRLVVIRKIGYVSSVSFETEKVELLKLVVFPGLNSIVVTPSPEVLAHRTLCMIFIQNDNTGIFHPARCIHSDRCVNICSSTFEVIGLKQNHIYNVKIVPFSHYSEKIFQIKTKNHLEDYYLTFTKLTGDQLRIHFPKNNHPDTHCDYELYSSSKIGDSLKLVKQCDYATHCSVKCSKGFIIDNKYEPKITQFNVRPRHFGLAKTFVKKSVGDQYINIKINNHNDPYIEADYETDRVNKYAHPSLDFTQHDRPVLLRVDEPNIYDVATVRTHKTHSLPHGNELIMNPNHEKNIFIPQETVGEDGRIPGASTGGKIKKEKNKQTDSNTGGVILDNKNVAVITSVGTKNVEGVIAFIILLVILIVILVKWKKRKPFYAVAQITR